MPATSRRSTMVLALLAIAAVLAAGCTAGGEQATGAGGPGLRIAVSEDFGPLNILNQSEDQLTFLVYDRLVAPSPYAADPQPWLATDVRQVDPSTWVVPLRNDVTWHDGQPFTAQDVAFTIQWFKTVPSGTYSHHVTTVPEIERVEVLGKHKVRFHCAYPCPFLGSVTLAHIPMLPEHVWSKVDEPTKYTKLPVGTGPYRLTSYDPDTGYRFEANRDHFAGPPRVDTVLMPIIEDSSAAFTALRTGEVDAVARQVPPELVDQFQQSDQLEVAETTPLRFPEMEINYQRPPLDQPKFRRAISKAINRQQLLKTVWLGKGKASTKGYPHPASPWTNPELRTTYDPAAARRLLAELGFTDSNGDGIRENPAGQPLSFTIKVAGNEPTYVRAAQLVSDQLRAVGIGMGPVRALDPGSVRALNDSQDFDFVVDQITAHGTADPTQFIMSHFSGYLWDLPKVPYPRFQALFEQWKAATTVRGRKQVSFAMQDLFNSQPTSIPLHYPAGRLAYRPQAYDGWVESPGYGIFHKWSLLPRDVSRAAGALVGNGQ